MKELINYLNQTKDIYAKSSVQLVDGLFVKNKDILKRIELYYNSKYESGDTDALGQNKPFYNIVKFRVNIATTNTDLDTKDIQIISDNPEKANYVWLFQKEVYKWMKESQFSKFLNDFGQARAKYGSVFVKKTETQDNLTLDVCNIHNISFDPKEFTKYTPIYEVHHMTIAELSGKGKVWQNVEKVTEEYGKREKNSNEYNNGDIKIYEVVGCLDGKYFNKDGFPFYHIFYTCEGEDTGTILYEEEIEINVYKKCDWDRVNGRSLGVGVVEDGFEAQRATNDIVQRQKGMIDVASKIIFHTDDTSLGNNVLTELENGDVITTEDGKTFTQVNNVPSTMPVFTSYLDQWDRQIERATSTFNAITGENMPSNTPYRSVAILNSAATSLYQYRMEEAGIFLQELFEDWIFPHIEKTLNKEHILAEDFSSEELQMIDETFSSKEANTYAKNEILAGNIVDAEGYQKAYDEALKRIQKTKIKRYIDIPKNLYKDMYPKVTVLITGENKNKGVILESLSRVLADVAGNPAILQNPITSKIFARIVEMSNIGIAPSELASMANKMNQQLEQQPAEMPQ